MRVSVVDQKGKDTGRQVDLSKDVFGVDPNEHALYLDVKQYLAHQRQGTHKTKERAEIKGSTRKIKKQKGTGTARAGSIKNPLFRSGGRTFGPRVRSYNQKVNKNNNYSFYDSYCKKYTQHCHELTNHVLNEKSYQDTCETDNARDRGVFIKPTIMFWLENRYPEVTTEITTTIPPDEKNVLVLNWLTLFNLSDQDRDMIFGLYKGHVFVDDTFEVHPTRTYVMEMLLKDMGYNLDKVTFWTNCPTPDNRFEKSIIRHNWLHLQEYGRMLNSETRFKIPVFNDEGLLNYENKKYKVLSLNGHSTFPREYILSLAVKEGLVNKANNSKEIRSYMVGRKFL